MDEQTYDRREDEYATTYPTYDDYRNVEEPTPFHMDDTNVDMNLESCPIYDMMTMHA